MKSKVIVALDVPEASRAIELTKSFAPHVAMVKIGLETFVAHGPRFVHGISALGVDVFLDLKLHDIPRTVAAAASQAARLGVRLLTVHAAGGSEMVRAAKDAAPDVTVVAVTMLTSLDDALAREIGFDNVESSAKRLGALAREAGADGLVCSALELEGLADLGGVRVVPGVRLQGSDHGDQRRVVTPSEAMEKGATWIVVGRPILNAPDPVAAARDIAAETLRF